MLLPESLRFGSTERYECDKCASLERIVLNNHAWSLSAYHFRRSCGAASLEIYDNDTATIGSLSHVRPLPSKTDCSFALYLPTGFITNFAQSP
jgi:hypothetical protein